MAHLSPIIYHLSSIIYILSSAFYHLYHHHHHHIASHHGTAHRVISYHIICISRKKGFQFHTPLPWPSPPVPQVKCFQAAPARCCGFMAGFIILSFSKERRGKAPDAHFSIAAPSLLTRKCGFCRFSHLRKSMKIAQPSGFTADIWCTLTQLEKVVFSANPWHQSTFPGDIGSFISSHFSPRPNWHATCRGQGGGINENVSPLSYEDFCVNRASSRDWQRLAVVKKVKRMVTQTKTEAFAQFQYFAPVTVSAPPSPVNIKNHSVSRNCWGLVILLLVGSS